MIHNPDQNGTAKEGECRRLYLLDAMALAYRAHFIFISRPLINSKGQNTSASYGFTAALLKLLEDHKMDYVLVVFDATDGGGNFRDAIYADYKAHRAPIPEDLLANLPYIKRIVEAMDIPVMTVPGVEADDVIGTLAVKAREEGQEVVIVSPDKDFQQLLGGGISIFRPAHRGEEFDPITEHSFREKFGLEPIQFIDVLALMGDASDNVPGVPGIGEKTAIKLIQEYGTVENLLEHVDEVTGKKPKEGLLNHRDDALLSKTLVTIRTDVDVSLDWVACKKNRPNELQLESIFGELEFQSLLGRIRAFEKRRENGNKPAAEPVEEPSAEPQLDADLQFDFGDYVQLKQIDDTSVDYRIVRHLADLEAFIEELSKQDRITFDTETTSTDQMYASLVGMSFSWQAGQAYYVPTPLPDGTSTEMVLERIKPILQRCALNGHNLKYDLAVMARHGVPLDRIAFDSMVAHYLLAPEEPHNMDASARKFLNYRAIPISDLIGTGKNQLSMRVVPIDQAGRYSCEDADVTHQLWQVLHEELKKVSLLRIAEEMEFPLIAVLTEMELHGIKVDPSVLKDISRDITAALIQIEENIYRSAGEKFNIGSTQQLGEILFDRLKLPVVEKTSKGKASTRENVLEDLAVHHELPGLILDWRHLSKLKSTYVDSLGDLIHPETGRIHTSFNQTVAATGRLSSTNPNLQNIPVRTEMGREIRKAFVAEPGNVLVSADYVQIELRILASLSGDETLKQAFFEGQDIHTATAARVFNISTEKVTRDQRRKAKEVNYGIPYGISPWGLARRLRTSNHEAQELIEQYQRSFPRVMQYLTFLVEEARAKGYAETGLGRRRYIPGIHARNRTERSFAERVAVNMPIQGTQADMIKLAMVSLCKRLKAESLSTRMVLQVHDELVFEVPERELEQVKPMIEQEMVSALPLDVPVLVELGTGKNWLDAH